MKDYKQYLGVATVISIAYSAVIYFSIDTSWLAF